MLHTTLHNESALVQAMQSGSQEAFTTLYRHYSPRLYLNVLGMVRDPESAEELVQELFSRIWQKRDCRGIGEDFTGYMYRIALNLVHDFFRRLKRDRRLRERFSGLAGEFYEHIEQRMEQQQLASILQQAIERLPKQQKKAYQLVRVEGKTYKSAAEEMGISPLTVKEYLVAANKSIRVNLSGSAGPLFLAVLAAFDLLG
ncbi:MAG: sigma-70 family RNA polymerase sigma factor [Bacteroidetes bacterium]|nr:sigma-70 family RNA polymerase sigma factor [Bacteroidota bacterium]